MRKFLTFLWLVGVPLVGVAISFLALAPTYPDTSRATADKIRPGMTVAEAERVIGAPPWDYRRPEDQETFRSISGNTWRHVITWTTYQGKIEVVDGWYGIQKGNRLENWCTADGVIDDVRWSPVDRDSPSVWPLWTEFAVAALLAVALPPLLYAATRRDPGSPGRPWEGCPVCLRRR